MNVVKTYFNLFLLYLLSLFFKCSFSFLFLDLAQGFIVFVPSLCSRFGSCLFLLSGTLSFYKYFYSRRRGGQCWSSYPHRLCPGQHREAGSGQRDLAFTQVRSLGMKKRSINVVALLLLHRGFLKTLPVRAFNK